jgi:hypothetical protein
MFMTNQERIERAGKLSVIANREFLSENRELLVSFDRELVSKSMLAIVRLDFADEIQNSEPDITTYLRIQERAFLMAFDRGAIQPISEITSLGWDAIERMRRENGIGVESVPTPTPALSPAQELEQTVRNDWRNLSSKQIKAKMQANRLYRECLERLSSELESSITEHVTIPGA